MSTPGSGVTGSRDCGFRAETVRRFAPRADRSVCATQTSCAMRCGAGTPACASPKATGLGFCLPITPSALRAARRQECLRHTDFPRRVMWRRHSCLRIAEGDRPAVSPLPSRPRRFAPRADRSVCATQVPSATQTAPSSLAFRAAWNRMRAGEYFRRRFAGCVGP